MLRLPLVLNQV